MPGRGLGDNKFGIKREDLKVLLAEPKLIDRFSYLQDAECWAETWGYNNLELSFGFDEDNDWKFIDVPIIRCADVPF